MPRRKGSHIDERGSRAIEGWAFRPRTEAGRQQTEHGFFRTDALHEPDWIAPPAAGTPTGLHATCVTALAWARAHLLVVHVKSQGEK